MVRRRLGLGLALAIDVVVATGASAHGVPPQITQIIVEQPDRAVVATSRGILFGDPGAHAWSLVCSDAFGVAEGLGFRVAQVPGGRLYVASLKGLASSDDRGCTWSPHPQLGALDVTSLSQEPARPTELLVTAFGTEGGVHVSDDGGAHFRRLYEAAGDEFLNSVQAAPSEPARLYATLSTTAEHARLFVLRSRDRGASWERTELLLHDEPIDVQLLAVHPRDPDQLLVRVRYVSGWSPDALLYSADGAATFSERAAFPRIAAAAFSSDGTTSFVVASDALLRSSVPPDAFSRVSVEDRLTYGQVFGSSVLVGGYRATDGRLGVNIWSAQVAAPDAELAPWMSFAEVGGLQQCAAPSRLEARCALEWLDWSNEFLP